MQVLAGYTWSHSIDNGSSDSGIYVAGHPASADRGSSSFDIRHNFTAGITYSVPAGNQRMQSRVTRNWELSAFLRARTGFPIDVLTTENLLGLGFDNFRRPDLVAGVRRALVDRDRISAAGLERAKTFTWRETARITADVYREVLAA